MTIAPKSETYKRISILFTKNREIKKEDISQQKLSLDRYTCKIWVCIGGIIFLSKRITKQNRDFWV